jgi:methionyl-tRNA formyltransferase
MQKMLDEGIRIVGAVTVADKPAGRGQQMHESPVKRFAVAHDIPVLQPLKLKDEDFLADLSSWNADVFVVVAFRMLPAEVWKMPKKGTFNLHASLLPDYRGAAPINWAIINGDRETGVSTFFIDKAIDTGNVIGQTKMPIGENETAGELHDRMIATGGELVVKTLHAIEAGTVRPVPQSEMTHSPQRPAPKLFRENTQIDWTKPVGQIHQLVCGLSPYPAAWTRWTNAKGETKQIKLFRTAVETKPQSGTGKLSANKQSVRISCNDGDLVLLEFQVEGKKRMTAREWLVGNTIADWKLEDTL